MADVPTALAAALADRYRLDRELGHGGMATVYLAEDLKHRRMVAIKFLRPDLAQALGAERFLREIETTAALHHPHILPLYDSGIVPGAGPGGGDRPYYVMPFVEGESLRERLDREKQLPLDDALQIAREIADALSYAHSHGVIHRDIKPENILLEGGHAVVADFGIAKAVSAGGAGPLTQTGVSLGTPLYMSPEQASGERELDGRSDLYSLGCVLYEMLAGRPPFTGPTMESVAHQHLVAPPTPITQLRPAVPTAIAGVIERALAKNPADRFSPVVQFTEALQAQRGATAAPAAGRQLWRRLTILLVLVVMTALGYALLHRSPLALPALGRSTQVTLDPGLELDPALSPDGRMVAYASGPLGQTRIFVRQVSGGRPIDLSGGLPGDHRNPEWSPDGSRISFDGDGGVYVVPALGGSPTRFFAPDSGFQGGVVWSPDGTMVAYVQSDRVIRRTLATGASMVVAELLEPTSLAWSPDGRWLAVVSGNPWWSEGKRWVQPGCGACAQLFFANLAPTKLMLLPAAGGTPIALTDGTSLDISPTWLPDGRLAFISDREGTRDVFLLALQADGSPAGAPQRLTTGLAAHGISIAASGTALAYSQFRPSGNVWSAPLPATGTADASSTSTPVTRGNQNIEGISVTPDGKWLAFDSDREGNADIYKLALPDGEPIRLTTDPAAEFVRAWSWDGKWLGGHTFHNGNRDALLVSADGATSEIVLPTPAHERYAQLAPDGRTLLFTREEDGTQNVFVTVRSPAGDWGDPRRVTVGGGAWASWSPDGTQVLYGQIQGGRVSVVTVASGESRDLVIGPVQGWTPITTAWDPSGQTVYFLATDSTQRVGLWSVPAGGGTPRMRVLFTDPARTPRREEFATDGRRVYFTLADHQSDIWVMQLTQP